MPNTEKKEKPYLALEVTLFTDFSQVFDEKYRGVTIATIINVKRISMLSPEAKNWAEELLNSAKYTAVKTLNTAKEAMIENNSENIFPEFPGETTLKIPSTNPAIREYVDLLHAMDRAAVYAEAAWLTGSITPQEKTRMLKNLEASVRRISRAIKKMIITVKDVREETHLKGEALFKEAKRVRDEERQRLYGKKESQKEINDERQEKESETSLEIA